MMFYLCLSSGIEIWVNMLVWLYVVLSVIHSLIQISTNQVLVRFTVFGESTIALIAIAVRVKWPESPLCTHLTTRIAAHQLNVCSLRRNPANVTVRRQGGVEDNSRASSRTDETSRPSKTIQGLLCRTADLSPNRAEGPLYVRNA